MMHLLRSKLANSFVVRVIRFVAFPDSLAIIVHLAFRVRWITIVEFPYLLEPRLFNFFYTSKERLLVRFHKLCGFYSFCPTLQLIYCYTYL